MSQPSLIEAVSEIDDLASVQKHWPYPQYSNSGSAWLGELPAHWTARRLKFVAISRPSNVDKKSTDGELPVRLCNYVDVYKNDYITPDLDFMQATADAAELSKFRLRRGDVLITKDSEEWNDIAIPSFVTQDSEDIVCGYHLSQVRPRAGVMDGEYLFRAFRAGGVSEQFQVAANGVTRFGTPAGAISDVMFPVPPLDEQRAIALFLRKQTTRIDRLIAEKLKLIATMAERLGIVSSRLATTGVNANGTKKCSEVPWLGDVPTHWKVLQLKRLFHEMDYGVSESLNPTGAVAILRMGNIREGELDLNDLRFLDDVPASLDLRKNDILFNRTNSLALVGKVALVRETPLSRTSFASYLVRFRVRSGVDPEYVCMLLNRPETLARARALALPAIGQANLNPNRYGYLTVCLPPFNEQREIVRRAGE